jgi:predicted regulator of Ras-like GTPase activity (Roadblock/LC7/MglB family)
MSFATILRSIVDECGGGMGAALMGNDGIPIEEYVVAGASASPLRGDIATAGVEFGRILGETRKAADALSAGPVEESIVRMAQFSLIFRSVEDGYFLVVAVAPDGNLGRARYLMRRHLVALRQEF